MDRDRHTALFFGDSATRGYGVGREGRYAALVERALATGSGSGWTFEIAAAQSDFRELRTRLDAALARVRPVVLVCQCPVGPACWFPRFPAWVRAFLAVEQRLLARMREARVASELRADDTRTRHEALYEGRYVNRVMRWKPTNWPIVGRFWSARVVRYPTIPKVSCEGYVQRVVDFRERARAAGVREALFIGLLPVADDVCPGYRLRVPGWIAELQRVLDDPAHGSRFLDVHAVLRDVPLDRLLVKDRIHLSEEGHRRVAALVAPALEPLLVRVAAAHA